MPKEPPSKKQKQMDIKGYFQQTRKKQTARDYESEETSQVSDKETMARSFKTEVGEGPSKDLQQRAEEQKHNFFFHFNSDPEPVFVACNSSMTVLDALHKKDTFRMNENVRNTKKEMVIQRSDRAAVKTDFPCCLVDKKEILEISFIKKDKKAFTEHQTQGKLLLPKKDLVTFKIKTTGGKKVKYIMKNRELTNTVDYVCVYAFKEEEVKTALERDGRFIDKIFQKLCVLSQEFKGKAKKVQRSRYEMSDCVVDLDQKTFQIIAIGDRQTNIQKKLTKTSTKPNVASAADSEKIDPGQYPTNTEQKTFQERKTKSAGPSTKGHATQNTSRNSFGYSGFSCSADIKDILQTQCKVLLEMLQNQENQDKELYQEEYDKSLQSFTDVKNVKRVMELSDSVCLIRVENSARGTGFLLFDRFILTNAHVVKDFVYSPQEAPHTLKLSRTFMALFSYEVMGSVAEVLSVKDDVVAYGYVNDEQGSHDFALLELEAAPNNCTELLKRCKHAPSPNSGGIYIVGHPGCEVKKMDPCFIIGIENQLQSINKHISENVSCPYVSWQCWPYLHQNRITYDTCFFHGSSGSPVFDEHCYLIGMHSGGFHYKNDYTGRSVIEFSVSIQSIIKKIITQVETRSDILELLSKFEYIQKITSEADMPMREEKLSEKVENMDVN